MGVNETAAYAAVFVAERAWHTVCMKTLLRLLGTLIAVVLTVSIVPGIEIVGGTTAEGWITTILVAVVWSVISLVIRPVLSILTLPITILSFGIFSLILNALLFWLMAAIVPGFYVAGFLSALMGAVVLSVLNWLIQKVF